MLLYKILAYDIYGKIRKSHTEIINLKYQLRHGMNNLNYQWIIFFIRYLGLF